MRKNLTMVALMCVVWFFPTAEAYVFNVINNWPNTSIEAITIGANTYQLPSILCGSAPRKIDARLINIKGSTISLRVRFKGCIENYNVVNFPVIVFLPSDSGAATITFQKDTLAILVNYSTSILSGEPSAPDPNTTIIGGDQWR